MHISILGKNFKISSKNSFKMNQITATSFYKINFHLIHIYFCFEKSSSKIYDFGCKKSIHNSFIFLKVLKIMLHTLCIHSYSPYNESNVPFCNDLSFNVNRGPSSCKPVFFAFLNIYLLRKN